MVWRSSMSVGQRSSLQQQIDRYRQRHGHEPGSDPACLFDCGQSHDWTSNVRGLPTLRRNTGPLWSPWKQRWLTNRERATAMGYPVFPDLAQAAGVSMVGQKLPNRSIGNAMHVPSVGVVLALVLVACEPQCCSDMSERGTTAKHTTSV